MTGKSKFLRENFGDMLCHKMLRKQYASSQRENDRRDEVIGEKLPGKVDDQISAVGLTSSSAVSVSQRNE